MSDKISSFGDSFNQAGQTHSIELILFPLLFLILTGIVGNNFALSGIQTSPTLPSPTCQNVGICFVTNNNGCDVNVTKNCNLNTVSSFSFLSPNSPFTALFSGNIGQFVNDFTAASQSNLATNQPFSFFPNATQTNNLKPNDTGTTVFGVCGNINGTNWGGANGGLGGLNLQLQCNQNFVNATQVPRTLGGVQYSKIFNNVAPHEMNCTSFGSATSGGSAGATKYVYYGCDAKNPVPTGAKYAIVAVNATTELLAASGGNNTQLFTWILLTFPSGGFHSTNDPNYCALAVGFGAPFISITTNAPSFYCTQWGSAIHTTVGTNNQGLFGVLLSVGFIAGLVFLVLGLGIGLNVEVLTNGLGMTPDDQGTKLMQVMGIGLVAWTFVFSEFSSWIFLLGFGLGLIIETSLTAMFFFGLYWRTFDIT